MSRLRPPARSASATSFATSLRPRRATTPVTATTTILATIRATIRATIWATILALALGGCGDDSPKEPDRNGIVDSAGGDAGADAGSDASTDRSIGDAGDADTDATSALSLLDGLVVDLRADTNRDGVVDFDDPADELGEDDWTPAHGAVFLANLDDDSSSCTPTSGQLSGCHDAADEIVNGPADLIDMARLRIAALPEIGHGVAARLQVEPAGRVRLFEGNGEAFRVFDPANDSFSADRLRSGVELAVEGLDVMRGDGWDGLVTIRVTLYDETAEETAELSSETALHDTVQLRVAPVVLRHHLDRALEIYSSELGVGGDGAFSDEFDDAVQAAGVPRGRRELDVEDQWTQDFFETGYMAMPGPQGLQVIDVFIRSANIESDYYDGSLYLRPAGAIAYTEMRGPDTAGLTAYTTQRGERGWNWDTLNSFGNTETIPPYTLDEQSFPLGRVIRGTGPGGYKGDDAMVALLEAQMVQPPVYVDTSWLLVGHIDETISFVKADTPRGWLLVVNDPAATVALLQGYSDLGHGDAPMFTGKSWVDYNSGAEVAATATIDQALGSNSVMTATAEAAIFIDEQLEIIKAATGLTEEEIVRVPFLHMDAGGGASVAFQPGVVNGISLTPTDFAMPRPHGPVIEGHDVMIAATEAAFEGTGITLHWVEDWDILHRLSGEVHCGSNALREVPQDATWWSVER